MDLSLREIIDIYQTQTAAVDRGWQYFSAVTIAVLGFTISSEKATKSLMETLVIALGYLAFSLGNLSAIRHLQSQAIGYANVMNDRVSDSDVGALLGQVTPFTLTHITTLHVTVTVAVILAIIVVARRRKKPTMVSDTP